MKGDAIRWVVLLLTVILLVGIQHTAWKRLILQEETDESPIYNVDLKTIEKTWKREIVVETPDRLVEPIKQAFTRAEAPVDPAAGNGTGLGGEESPNVAQGAIPLIGVIAPVEGGGFPLVIVSLSGDRREVYEPGEVLPNGWVLQRVEDLGEREYRIWFHDAASNEVKAQNFKGGEVP